MAEITGLEPDGKKKGRVLVWVDGEPKGTLAQDTCARRGLITGSPMDDDLWTDIQLHEEAHLAFDRALTYLERSARSRAEILRHLADRGFDPAAMDVAMEKLERYGYVDDPALAQALVRDQAGLKKSGRRRLEQTLYKRGIPRPVSDETLSALTGEGEQEGARALLPQLMRRYAGVEDPRERRRKIAAALSRRGYDWDAISPLLGDLDGGDDSTEE